MSVKARNRVCLVSCVCVIVASLSVLAFYRIDSSPYVAVSCSSVEEIVTEMSRSKYIRFVEDLGVYNNQTLFSYRWENYTFFEIYSCIDEVRELARSVSFKLVDLIK